MRIEVLDHGYVELIETWGSDERIIEAARMSTDGAFRGWSEDARLLAYLYNNKHLTPFEMAGAIFEIKAPIFVFREWHRHRTQSYNEMSARYIPMPDEHFMPHRDRIVEGSLPTANRQAGGSRCIQRDEAMEWQNALAALQYQSQAVYEMGLRLGVPKELARLAVTVGRYSKMRACANLRNWLAFLELRNAPNAQLEIQEYARAVQRVLAVRFPRTLALFEQGRDAA